MDVEGSVRDVIQDAILTFSCRDSVKSREISVTIAVNRNEISSSDILRTIDNYSVAIFGTAESVMLVYFLSYSPAMKMEAICSPETSEEFHWTTRCLSNKT
jgi:hypothetical protein